MTRSAIAERVMLEQQELTMDTPVHDHDCDECIYVGSEASLPGEPRCNQVDMYIHLRPPGDPSGHCLIRRYGSEGHNYGSMSEVAKIPKYQRVLAAYMTLNP